MGIDIQIVKSCNYNEIYNYLERINKKYPNQMMISNVQKYSRKITDYANVYFMEKNTNIIGMLAFYSNDLINKSLFISSISLIDGYQGYGFGQQFMNFIVNRSCDLGMHEIKLEVKNSNSRAIAFYKKNGFVLIGENDINCCMTKIV